MLRTKNLHTLQNITLAALLAVWRYLFCYEYVYVTFEHMVTFQAPMPFASRVLLPAIARVLGEGFGISPQLVFLCSDFLFAFLFFVLLTKLFALSSLSDRASFIARCAVGGYIALLYAGLSTLRIYYPWDVPSAALTLLSIFLVVRGQNVLFVCAMLLALMNRETAALFPLIYFGLAQRSLLNRVTVSSALIVTGVFVEFLLQTQVASRSTGEVTTLLDYSNRLNANFNFLIEQPLLFVLVSLPVPLYWAFVGVRSASPLRGLVYVSSAFYLLAFLFGNAYEPRVFVEAVVATAVPFVCWYVNLRHRASDDFGKASV